MTEAPRPDALAVVRRIEASLAAGGFTLTRDSVAGRRAVIGRRAQLRLRGASPRLHTFVLVAVFKSDASPEHLDRFLHEAAEYATTVKGGLRAGSCAVAVAVVESADAAGEWAVDAAGAPSFPVLVDVGAGRVVYPDLAQVGGVAMPHLRDVVAAHVVPSVDPA